MKTSILITHSGECKNPNKLIDMVAEMFKGVERVDYEYPANECFVNTPEEKQGLTITWTDKPDMPQEGWYGNNITFRIDKD